MGSLLFHRERGPMPGPRLPMRKIRDVLRLSAGGMSKRKIAASLGVSPTAAGECIRRARRFGLGWPLPEEMTDEALESRLYPPPASKATDQRPRPDWARVHCELRLNGGTTPLLLISAGGRACRRGSLPRSPAKTPLRARTRARVLVAAYD